MKFFHRPPASVPDLPSSGGEAARFATLIVDHLPYIEKQCRRAVTHDQEWQENDADELLNEVIDRLKADDFKALREFRGGAKLTTYLTTIISHLVVDIVRQKRGRSRARERAEGMGDTARRLYDLVFGRGCTLHEAQRHLEIAFGIVESAERLQEMLDRMRGREAVAAPCGADGWLAPGREVLVDDEVEIIVADPRKGSEELLLEREREDSARTAAQALVAELTGEERFMLRLRFPEEEEEEPKTAREIAELLGTTEKAVDGRLRRILARMREYLLQRGLSLDDFIGP